jgi:hypothetical protein
MRSAAPCHPLPGTTRRAFLYLYPYSIVKESRNREDRRCSQVAFGVSTADHAATSLVRALWKGDNALDPAIISG